MLVIAGRVVELDAHLGRLSTSVEALYGRPLPARARTLVADRAAGLDRGKLRLTATPTADAPRLQAEAEEIDPGAVFPGPERAAALRSHLVAGGLGEHKWADRDLLDRIAGASPGELPLLLDADGTVLEGSRASVFVVDEEELVTPPVDGRILPSIARQHAIEAATREKIRVREERLGLADLHAHEVFLTGSVRGIEPARFLDGAELAPPGEISERLAGALRCRWRVPAEEPVATAATAPPGGPHGH